MKDTFPNVINDNDTGSDAQMWSVYHRTVESLQNDPILASQKGSLISNGLRSCIGNWRSLVKAWE